MITTKDSLVFEEPYSISLMITRKDKTKLASPIFIGLPYYKKGNGLKIDIWPFSHETIEIYPGITGTFEVRNTIITEITKVRLVKIKKQCYVDVKEL